MNWKASTTSAKDFLAEDINEEPNPSMKQEVTLTPEQTKETTVSIIDKQLNGTSAQDIANAVKAKRTPKVKPVVDPTNPDHYKVGGIETIEFIKAKLTFEEYQGYLKGNVLKYASRIGHKGDPVVDAGKLNWYSTALTNVLKGE
jgi:hypothetical protein